MLSILDGMINCIRRAYPKYRVNLGYKNILSDRPVITKAVYVTAGEVRKTELDFVICVYTPISEGGNECVKTACEIYNVLYSGGLELKNISVGAVEYDNNSQGFVVKIKGTAEDDSLEFGTFDPDVNGKSVNCTAEFEGENGTEEYGFRAASCKITCNTGYYPIMTVFDSEPVDVIESVRGYKIVLDDVSAEAAEIVSGLRCFKLFFENIGGSYEKCYCEKVERNSDGKYSLIFLTREDSLSVK